MPLPGERDTTFGRRASYSPTSAKLESRGEEQHQAGKPYDQNLNMQVNRSATGTPSEAQSLSKKKKIIIGIGIIAVLLLVIVLAVTLTKKKPRVSPRAVASAPVEFFVMDLDGTAENTKKLPTTFEQYVRSNYGVSTRGTADSTHSDPKLNVNDTEFISGSEKEADEELPQMGFKPLVYSSDQSQGYSMKSKQANGTKEGAEETKNDKAVQTLKEKFERMVKEAVSQTPLCVSSYCTKATAKNITLDGNRINGRFDVKMEATDYDTHVFISRVPDDELQRNLAEELTKEFQRSFPDFRLINVKTETNLNELCNSLNVKCDNVRPRPFTEKPVTSGVHEDVDADKNKTLVEILDRPSNGLELIKVYGVAIDGGNRTIAVNRYWSLPSMADCSEFGFQCSNHKERIPIRQRCDGIEQCSDGSDERMCYECATSFSCPTASSGKRCLRGNKLCDGTEDCESGLDETKLYCKDECEVGLEFHCRGSGRCIPRIWRCDGDPHCPEGDDEENCVSAADCNNGAHWCTPEHRCIPQWEWCDGIKHCSDGTDEANCTCVECSGSNTTLCRSRNGKCIPRSKLCDGESDCPGEEDEQNCPGWCKAENVPMIKCVDDKLYPKRYACSGTVPQCQNSCSTCDPEVAFQCSTTNTCIPRHKMCDGTKDCIGGSDESPELCTCIENESFICPGQPSKCLPNKFRCDGYHDCLNGADEQNCSSCYNNDHAFYCNLTKTCYPSLNRCNGILDCADYSDEDNCSCEECKYQVGYKTFTCKQDNRCLSREHMCKPDSLYRCPENEPEEEQYCKMTSPLLEKAK